MSCSEPISGFQEVAAASLISFVPKQQKPRNAIKEKHVGLAEVLSVVVEHQCIEDEIGKFYAHADLLSSASNPGL